MTNDDRDDLLGRLDERTKLIQVSAETQAGETNRRLDQLSKSLERHQSDMKQDLDNVRSEMEENFVRKERYSPIEKIVFGLVGLILTSVVGALVAMALGGPK